MSVFFFDSSAVVKFHVLETGSAWVKSLLLATETDGSLTNEVFMANITAVEVTAALTRLARGASSPPINLSALLALFQLQIGSVLEPVALTDSHIVLAVSLAQKHALRGYDAVQLAVALALNRERVLDGLPPIVFIAADTELLAAAHAEGLPVDNPNLHP